MNRKNKYHPDQLLCFLPEEIPPTPVSKDEAKAPAKKEKPVARKENQMLLIPERRLPLVDTAKRRRDLAAGRY